MEESRNREKQLERELKWYRDTYEHRKLIGIIKDRVLLKFKNFFSGKETPSFGPPASPSEIGMPSHFQIATPSNESIDIKDATPTVHIESETSNKAIATYDAAFDVEYYLETYPDIKKALLDPVNHYLTRGWREGRNPNKKFLTNYYLSTNPDVKNSGINPFLHYINHGRFEERSIRPKFLNVEQINKGLSKIESKDFSTMKTDIIIPVYNGFDFISILFSQLKKHTNGKYKIYVIDDCSTDERVKPFLDAQKNVFDDVEIIYNAENQGFVKSVNAGLALTTNNVVILNSDTDIPAGWLERLMYPIWTNDSIASVTPMTNAGTVASFPLVLQDNEIFLGMDVNDIDETFKKYHPATYVETPTGVGFCMAMSRKALDKTGIFDQDAFQRGYGEENDWCMRALKEGFINVISAGLFVWHKHGGSFTSEEKQKLIEKNTDILMGRHPEYLVEVKKHISENPLTSYRFYSFIDLCCRHAATGISFYLDHRLGGGANFYSLEKIAEESDLKPVGRILWDQDSGLYQIEIRYKSYSKTEYFNDVQSLFELMDIIKINSFFYNNVYPFPEPQGIIANILTLQKKKKFEITVAIHDFYPVCQSFVLLNDKGKFCGAETDPVVCAKCIQGNERIDNKNISIGSWRSTWLEFFKSAKTIICFSHSSKDILLKVYPNELNSKIQVIPHKTAQTLRKPILRVNDPELHVGIVGSINFHKGSEKVKEIVEYFDKIGKGKVTIIGSLIETEINSPRLTVTGKYTTNELPMLIEKSGATVFFFSSIWPETFSYVVSELMDMDLPIVSYDIGAPAERIKNYKNGSIVLLDEPVESLVDVLTHAKVNHLEYRIANQIELLKSTPLFDKDFYLTANSDVAAVGMDAYYHYLLFGAKEGRNPSLKFDSAFYLTNYKEVSESQINPLIHYLEIGEKLEYSPVKTEGISLNKTGIKINSNLKVAVIIHAYYEDLINELLDYTRNIPINYTILISVVSAEGEALAKRWAQNKNHSAIKIKRVPNRGRDIAPAFIHFRNELQEFDLVCKLHSKKSLYTGGEQVVWRRQLVENLIGSEQIVRNILEMFQSDEKTGLVYPVSPLLPYWAYSWLSNKGLAYQLQDKLKIQLPLNGYIDYPMGSMFWFRPEALKHFTDGTIVLEDFKEEPCGNDGTFAHAIERAIAYVAKANGFNYIELNFFDNMYAKGTGSKNLYQYGRKSFKEIKQHIDAKKIVSFDIFDTLISRPLIEPDYVFTLIERSLDKQFNTKTNYFSVRKKAEHMARVKLKSEVGYTNIYDTMQDEKLLDGKIIEAARLAEFEFELKISSPRSEMIKVFNYAIEKKKRVILVSDMYLEKGQVMQLLHKNGIDNYSYLYLSSDVLKRKDNGLMWTHLEDTEKITSQNFIHIGDNEHSDIQLTTDKRLANYHVMSAYNMFLNSIIGDDFIGKYPYNWQKHLFLGPVINKLFNDPFLNRNTSRLDPILKSGQDTGYCVFGPIILSYFIWLCDEAKKAEIDTLYFLAREGYLLKEMFDYFVQLDEIKKHYKTLPESVYLLTSRRSVLGAVEKNKKVLKDIISNNYFNGTLRDLFFNRIGVDFNTIAPGIAKEQIAIPRDTNKVLDMVMPYIDQIQENATKEREVLLSYFDEIDYTSNKNVGLVDLGYSGTIQKYIYQLTHKKVKGYYFVTRDTTRQWTDENNETFGFFENDATGDSETSVYRYSLYLEFWLTAPDGQLSHFNKENGKISPVFKEKGGTKNDFYVNHAITDGVKEYLKDAVALTSGELELLNLNSNAAQHVFQHCVRLDLWDKETRKIAFLEDKFCGNEADLDVIKFSIGR